MATPRKDDGRGRATVRTSLVATVLLAGALILAACGSSGDGDSSGASGAEDELQVSTANWETDFSKSSVPLAEFRGGGPPKDGIPSIDDPKFVSVEEADGFLEGKEPIAVLEVGGKVRGYPIQILTWHEIVNDEIAGEPVAVTFCPLCNSTVAFSRDVGGETLEFGTTGNLRRSDLVMYDRTTESWWQQLTAEAVVGELTGETLEVLPSQIVSWNDFQQVNADAEVLSQDTGFSRSYGQNPYAGYDAVSRQPPAIEQHEGASRAEVAQVDRRDIAPGIVGPRRGFVDTHIGRERERLNQLSHRAHPRQADVIGRDQGHRKRPLRVDPFDVRSGNGEGVEPHRLVAGNCGRGWWRLGECRERHQDEQRGGGSKYYSNTRVLGHGFGGVGGNGLLNPRTASRPRRIATPTKTALRHQFHDIKGQSALSRDDFCSNPWNQ
jgi:hypothetical protein